MRKLKPSVKAAIASTLVLTSAAIAYAVPKVTSENSSKSTGNELKLDVERVDSDTVKVAIDNIQDIPKALQFSIRLDGVKLKDGENSIKDLVKKEVELRLKNKTYSTDTNSILTDYTYNEEDNTIDVLITSENSLPKSSNKVEVFELDVKGISNDTQTYKVLPNDTNEYKYVSNTNKEYNNLGVTHDNEEIQLNTLPTITVDDSYIMIVEGQTLDLTAKNLEDKIGLKMSHEDGNNDLTLEVMRDGKVIDSTFTEKTVGIYELELRAVKGTLKSEALKLTVNVALDNVTEPPTITMNDEELKNITLDAGSTFKPLENVKAVDKHGRDVEVNVTVDKDLDFDPDEDTIYTLTYTATDIYKNTAKKEIKLTVIANKAPVIKGIKDHILKVGDEFNPRDGVIVEDEDKDIELEVDDSNVKINIAGEYKVLYSATDSKGKTTKVQSKVTVLPKPSTINKVPIITAENKTIKVGDTFDPKVDVKVTDEDEDIISKLKVVQNDVDTSKAGTYTVKYSVTDSQGATGTKTIKVTVLPKTSAINKIPVITAENKTIKVGDTFDPKVDVTVTDEDEDIMSKLKVVENDVNTSKAGTYTVKYSVTDSKGATGTKTIKVTVLPKTSVINKVPVITAENKTIKVGDTFDPKVDVTVTDEDEDIISKLKVVQNDVDTSKAGTYTVKYSVTDSQGATGTKTIKVTVLQRTSIINEVPTISGAKDKTIKVGDSFDPKAGVTATDKEDGDITSKIKVSGNVDTSKAGEYKLVYSVEDSQGAKVSVAVTITVEKKVVEAPSINEAPVISGVKDKIIKVGDKFDPKAGVTATDKEDGDITSKIKVSGNVDTSKAGEYKLVYSVEDSQGAKVSVTVTITVLQDEVQKPVIPESVSDLIDTEIMEVLSGNGNSETPLVTSLNKITLNELNEFLDKLKDSNPNIEKIYKEGNETIFKIKLNDNKKTPKILRALFKSNEEVYIELRVKNEYTDLIERLNEFSEEITTVIYNTLPVIYASNITIKVGDSFDPMAGVTAYDKEDGDITKNIKVTGTVDTSKAGEYKLTYSVTDEGNATVELVRIITVVEENTNTIINNIPIINLSDLVIKVGSNFDPMTGVTATDKEDGDITKDIKVTGTVDTSKLGEYKLTYSVTDSQGATMSVDRTVTVVEDLNEYENPKTGDASILSYIGLASVAAGGLFINRKRSKR